LISIIGIVGVPARYGGFETLVENLLDTKGEFVVYCSSGSYENKIETYKSAKLVYLPLSANGISSIFYDSLAIIHSLVRGYNVLLLLGVSAGILIPLVRLFSGRRIVINVDGIEWKRAKWNRLAKWYLKFSERLAVRYSHNVIADNQAIADYILSEYGVVSNVIAYGGDHVLNSTNENKNIPLSSGYAFSVCRIEPENNIHIILEAFRITGLSLKFMGNWSASEYGRNLKLNYSSVNNIELIDPSYDINKLYQYRKYCRFYIHGHSAGGTNPSLVEAMFFSKAVFAFDCVYNRYTMDQNGCYFSDLSSLIGLLSAIDQLSLDKIGSELKKIADRNYTWDVIRYSYAKLLIPL
jgi:glycosyltransferase involved in cell wall biosynthesis